MQYFIIFSKKGIVYYEEGIAPSYINHIIRSINPRVLSATKSIRDDIMEYEIDDQIVYLSVSRAPVLQSLLPRFKKAVSNSVGHAVIDRASVDMYGSEETAEHVPSVQGKKGTNTADELDFSDGAFSGPRIIDSIKSIDVKRAFLLFSKKIDIKDLGCAITEQLIKKNVDPGFSKLITDDIMAEFRNADATTVTEAEFKSRMNETLRKIIPTVDHEAFIANIKSYTGVYSICFVGVNGVGKSTSLAKIACWLLQHGLKVYIAACDTFRAGAIEQLKVHVERFKLSGHGVGFYESGYSKDDASVAKSAIMRAGKEGYDVVLIDTAGRMHNKEHLMQSLSRLVKQNNPSHILFVGEALVGGDSLSHIREFNRWIGEGVPGRKIDSILLTKVDTVDDKIGQVLNLSFSAFAPILFLGTGQGNSDLTPMNSELIGELLTS